MTPQERGYRHALHTYGLDKLADDGWALRTFKRYPRTILGLGGMGLGAGAGYLATDKDKSPADKQENAFWGGAAGLGLGLLGGDYYDKPGPVLERLFSKRAPEVPEPPAPSSVRVEFKPRTPPPRPNATPLDKVKPYLPDHFHTLSPEQQREELQKHLKIMTQQREEVYNAGRRGLAGTYDDMINEAQEALRTIPAPTHTTPVRPVSSQLAPDLDNLEGAVEGLKQEVGKHVAPAPTPRPKNPLKMRKYYEDQISRLRQSGGSPHEIKIYEGMIQQIDKTLGPT